MRQKYLISRNDSKSELKISEFAVTERDINRNAAASNKRKARYTFLCAETYTRDKIQHSISKGIETVVASLRTENIFPIEPYAAKIAESVIALYRAPEDGFVELYFDDRDLLPDPINPDTDSG